VAFEEESVIQLAHYVTVEKSFQLIASHSQVTSERIILVT
jgi:hypothetical protein